MLDDTCFEKAPSFKKQQQTNNQKTKILLYKGRLPCTGAFSAFCARKASLYSQFTNQLSRCHALYTSDVAPNLHVQNVTQNTAPCHCCQRQSQNKTPPTWRTCFKWGFWFLVHTSTYIRVVAITAPRNSATTLSPWPADRQRERETTVTWPTFSTLPLHCLTRWRSN